MPTILIIEDDFVLRTLLTRMLQSDEYDLCGVADADAGLEVLKEQQIALVIADMGLPGMDGFKLYTTLREMPHTSRLPIICMSGRPHANLPTDDPLFAFLRKPFAPDILLATVARLMT